MWFTETILNPECTSTQLHKITCLVYRYRQSFVHQEEEAGYQRAHK